ncbi:hypothetical protein [Ponticoccus litoralis]|uniref:Uncharacterized protein n=1 Tax=Ponticoccus litoralis TaxID=422297 RepID=A0AAW9SQI1_9RHOB
MFGIWWTTSGVIEAPTATPRIVRAPLEIGPTPFSGAPSSAASRQAVIGPKRKGSGKDSDQKNSVPAPAMASVPSQWAIGVKRGEGVS